MSSASARDDKLPALRPVEVTPLRTEAGDLYVVLHDLSRIAPRPIAVSPAAYAILAHLDGEHSCANIQAAFLRAHGVLVPAADVLDLVRALDEALLLCGERYEAACAERRAAYLAAAARDNRDRYADGATLRREIEGLLAAGVPAPVLEVRGLIAPHLDYGRGRPCYADAYATLARVPPAERYVILGTNHAGRSSSIVATTKDFQTPLGLVSTDRGFIARLEQALGVPVCRDEVDHWAEHSVELQVHILQVLMDGRPFEIVPVLCPDVCGATGTAPAAGDGPDLLDFADKLAALVAESDRRTTIIAAADLSHVGQRFGDPQPTSADFLEAVARSDRELLSLLESRRDAAFLDRLRETGNPTRICSAGCICALLRALPDRPCRVLAYHQATNRGAETHVTCAAAVVT
jgi:hypothetical protein